MVENAPDLKNLYKENVAREDWCPGCGDFGFLRALEKALVDLEIPPWKLVGVPGIGCSGQIFGYLNGNTIKSDHGRILPLAFGIKTANPDLCVIGVGGDGDGLSIGMEHFMNTPRTNVDITYAILDNQIYGLTTGQSSPTTDEGTKTVSHPAGVSERAVKPIICALASQATFIARTASWDVPKTTEIIKAAITHKGFSFINDFSPCVTFNKVNTYDWFKKRCYYIEDEIPNYDRKNDIAAYALARQTDRLALGIFYQAEEPFLAVQKPLVDLPLEGLDFSPLIEPFV